MEVLGKIYALGTEVFYINKQVTRGWEKFHPWAETLFSIGESGRI